MLVFTLATIIVLLILITATFVAKRRAGIEPFAPDSANRGPYNIGLYDSPYYYPFYQGREYTAAWDGGGQCVTYCRADGCTVVCR